jgi:protein AATF/BFR2
LLNDMINKKLDQKQANNSAVFMLSKNKMQKSYDRMATKGRKLKYTVQESLVQFEIPRRKYYSWGDDQIDELFAGLFGMRIDMDDSDNDLSDSENKGLDEQKVEDISALKQSGVKLFG